MKTISDLLNELNYSCPIIDFTGSALNRKNYYGFDWFDRKVIELTDQLSEEGHKTVIVIDYAVSLLKDNEDTVKLVKDHINLNPHNPLLGPNDESKGPRFFSLNNLYEDPPALQELCQASVLAGLCPIVEPNFQEKQILIQAGATDYSYDLLPTALLLAHRGIKALGLVQSPSSEI